MVRVFLIFFLILGFAYAEKSEKPIVIEADTLEYIKNKQMILYKGNVVVKKEDFTLKSDTLKIFLDEKGDIQKIIALGDVRFVKGNRKGKSDRAEYYKNKNYIILIGNAELQQDNNVIEGDEIIYYIDTEKAEVIGKNKRVRTIFFPEEKGSKK
ncbi:lipopolysaccharide export system protein LptA [Persephonella hydrogeniphila]|uniref:Lipopolysaccharide export system protein LptA n=1 Tax=Persephonella hydrogeniphila TaxID=198703 RepID=A0A285MY33_9AQUI|nr:lipopolysaccharide transport periplasmic protein LptA [Persephonella hydrogeniphila]SNZ02130.1 lipopolysaccharide export system protein LptA [Persephonella hydrogeniphila]